MIYETWELNQQNLITFVMIDAAGNEVAGLGNAFTLSLSKNGGALNPSAGAKAEIGNGWYSYLSTAAEANTVGTISITVTAVGCRQQNLEYIVRQRTVNAIDFTYTVTNSVTLLPIQGIRVWFSTDPGGSNVVWIGYTDAFGVARDSNNNLPRLDAGTYYIRRQHSMFTFSDPDIEVVS